MDKTQQRRIPVTVITGFLGAGKTTLLRYLLRQTKQRLAVVVNEFGEVGIDAALIKGCSSCDGEPAPLIELANGCLCCTVQDDFLPTIEKLLANPEPLDGIVIETSGLALPEPLLQAFQWPQIKHRTLVNGVITVVDGEALAAGSVLGDLEAVEQQRINDPSLDHQDSIEDLFKEQLEQADLVLISRADLLSPDALQRAKDYLAEQLQIVQPQKQAPCIAIANGEISADLLLGLMRPSLPVEEEEHSHSHPELLADSLSMRGLWNRDGLEQILLETAINPMNLLRLKGRIPINGKALPLQVQAVGRRLNMWFEADGLRADQLEVVLIGGNPNSSLLRSRLEELEVKN